MNAVAWWQVLKNDISVALSVSADTIEVTGIFTSRRTLLTAFESSSSGSWNAVEQVSIQTTVIFVDPATGAGLVSALKTQLSRPGSKIFQGVVTHSAPLGLTLEIKMACAPGLLLLDESLGICVSCTPGKYLENHARDNTMNASEANVSLTNFTHSESHPECASCAEGTHKGGVGPDPCQPCSPGWQPVSLIAATACQRCGRHSYSADGTACFRCPEAQTDVMNGTSCACLQGYFNTSIVLAPASIFCVMGAENIWSPNSAQSSLDLKVFDECVTCPSACVDCSGQLPVPREHFWSPQRIGDEDMHLYKCPTDFGMSCQKSICKTGYRGITCQSCAVNFVRSMYSCDACDAGIGAVVHALACAFSILACVYLMLVGHATSKGSTMQQHHRRIQAVSNARTAVSFLQVQSLLLMFAVPMPSVLRTFRNIVLAMVSPSHIITALECTFQMGMSFVTVRSLLTITALPIIVPCCGLLFRLQPSSFTPPRKKLSDAQKVTRIFQKYATKIHGYGVTADVTVLHMHNFSQMAIDLGEEEGYDVDAWKELCGELGVDSRAGLGLGDFARQFELNGADTSKTVDDAYSELFNKKRKDREKSKAPAVPAVPKCAVIAAALYIVHPEIWHRSLQILSCKQLGSGITTLHVLVDDVDGVV